jgi:hypothetical protein
MGPVSGALLAAGTATVCAADEGVRSIFEVMTTVTAIEATAIRMA